MVKRSFCLPALVALAMLSTPRQASTRWETAHSIVAGIAEFHLSQSLA